MSPLLQTINLSDCNIVSELGEGGFGVVFHVEYGDPVKRAALKLLKPDLVSHPIYRPRFNNENDLLYQLIEHEGVITPYTKVEEQNGRAFYLMELADYDLQKFSDLATTTTAEKLEIFYQICEAVKAAHDMRIVHRDMHYGNVLVKKQDESHVAKLRRSIHSRQTMGSY
jgi:serine/threonine protein kinase